MSARGACTDEDATSLQEITIVKIDDTVLNVMNWQATERQARNDKQFE